LFFGSPCKGSPLIQNLVGIFTGKVVYNTFENGNWSDKEQRISSPFKGDLPFDLRVRILEGKYQVIQNFVSAYFLLINNCRFLVTAEKLGLLINDCRLKE
jgi:hypothetical protein